MNENHIENADETHFVFNMDNGRTVGFRSQEHVRYADVTSRNEGIAMMVRINRGKDAHVEVPMLVSLTKMLLSYSRSARFCSRCVL